MLIFVIVHLCPMLTTAAFRVKLFSEEEETEKQYDSNRCLHAIEVQLG